MPWFESIAALVSVWAVWLTTQRHPWCWPVGLVSVLLYAWVPFVTLPIFVARTFSVPLTLIVAPMT